MARMTSLPLLGRSPKMPCEEEHGGIGGSVERVIEPVPGFGKIIEREGR
jgi:hypothetical protein